jgi:tetratricopeptide (TPR) repeat protein
MAIIKCPECGQSVSELAANCPGCGCPISGNVAHCPECGAIVLKSYAECPNCHYPIQQFEEKKVDEDHLFQLATEAFNEGRVNQAFDYVNDALKNDGKDPKLLELQQHINVKLQGYQQKYTEAKQLFEEQHQPYPALALINKLVALDPADKYISLKEEIVSFITKEQIDKARTLISSGNYEVAQTLLSKTLSYDPDNDEIKAMLEEAAEKAERKRKRRKNITIGIIVSIIIIIVAIAGVFFYNIQAEDRAWDELQSSTNLNDYEQFLSEYPHGRHHDQVQALYSKLSTELTDWATVANSVDKYAVQKFLSKYPNGVCVVQAKNKLDSLSWIDACNINKPEAYAQYITDFPTGKYLNLAQQKTNQLKAMEVSPSETSQINGVIGQFFNALASQDETNLLGSVESTMTSFLNKRNATKAHVIAFMKQLHAPDMNSITFTVNKDMKITKKEVSDGVYSYVVTCTVDEKIDRKDTGKETFVNYGANLNIDNFMKISSLGLKKISSY